VKRLIPLLGLLFALVAGAARADLTIQITKGAEGALPIAVVPFGWNGPAGSRAPTDVAGIVSRDLELSGLFTPMAAKDMAVKPHDGREVNFTNWRMLGQDNLVVGKVIPQGNGRYRVDVQLFAVAQGAQLAGYSYPATRGNLRRTAHKISDMIYQTLTGRPGAFNTDIAYVTVTGNPKKPTYTLEVADVDGYNPRGALRSPQPIMSPAWSPDGQRLAYVSFETGKPAIFVQQVRTGKRTKVTDFPGINGAPAWSPDGKRLAVTLSKSGNPEIYILDLRSRRLLQLTHSRAIDTEPAWDPDGKSIVFTSDRGGSPQLYRIPVSGGSAQRLTFDGNYNARASISPDGKHIAMVHRVNHQFRIAVLDTDSGSLRVLTDGKLDESPSVAPNGSMVIYAADEGGRGVLAAVSMDGRVQQRLATKQGSVREPAWSPRPLVP